MPRWLQLAKNRWVIRRRRVADNPAEDARFTRISISSLPLNTEFRDETGRTVHLGDYFGKRPAILALVYYRCTMLCPEEMNGLVGALEMLKFTPGKDFDVIVVSFDPSDTPAEAASQKGALRKTIWTAGHREWLALPDWIASFHRCCYQSGWFWICQCSRAGWKNQSVRPPQLH